MNQIRTGYGHESNPERRWMRHTYQEGPGFLFLATRGGRPAGPRRGREELAIVRRRARLIRVAREEGIAAALALHGCSRATLFRWQAAFARDGLAALLPQRRGPRQPRFRHPSWVELVVLTVRLITYWNSKRIAAELRRRGIAQVSEFWIEELFDRLGTRRGSQPRFAGPRYERAAPNELWHVDIKGPFFIELCGQPLAVMSDNGTPFVVWMPGVLTRFGKTLRELEIRHIKTQINSPWTNGKIERFWGVLQAEVLDREVFRSLADAEAALLRYATYFNYHRLHGEIGWLTPAERFDGTPFTDQGFEHIPALEHLQAWLKELMAAA